MFEHRSQPLLPQPLFIRRLLRHAMISAGLLAASLLIGIFGYHWTEDLPWIDSLVNASMILGGMGPVNELHTVSGKLFASAYALFSGVIFLMIAGVLIAPAAHRLLHLVHIEEPKGKK